MAEKNVTIKDMIPHDGKKLRIAFIGDSITEGAGSTDRKTDSYPAQLGRMLGDGYEIGNFGKSGSYVLDADDPYNIKRADLSYRNTQQYKNSLTFGADVVVIILGILLGIRVRDILCVMKHYIEIIAGIGIKVKHINTAALRYLPLYALKSSVAHGKNDIAV